MAEVISGRRSKDYYNPVGIKTCVNEKRLEYLVLLHEIPSLTAIHEVTNEDVIKWMNESARQMPAEGSGKVITAIREVPFTLNTSDPKGSVLKFFIMLVTRLIEYNVGHVMARSCSELRETIIPKFGPEKNAQGHT